MKIINNKLTSELNIRQENNFPIDGINFIDITPLIINKNVFSEIISKFVIELKDKNIDYIVAPEARGFLFGSAIASKLNIGLIPVRKIGKLTKTSVEVNFDYEKEYGKDTLEIPKLVNDNYKDKKFYILDDIYATGNTHKAIEKAVKDLGGNVVGVGVVLNIKELNNNKDLFSIIDINES